MRRNNEDREKVTNLLKEKITQLEEQLKHVTEEAEKLADEFSKSDKMVKMLQNERDKMR